MYFALCILFIQYFVVIWLVNVTGLFLLLFQAVTKMVQEAFSYVEQITDMEIKLKLIDTLRTVTSGKVSDFIRLSVILILMQVFKKTY